LLFGLCRSVWVNKLLVNLPSPIPEFQHALLPPKCYEPRNMLNSLIFHWFHLKLTFEATWSMTRWKKTSAFFNPKAITSHSQNLSLPWNVVFLRSFATSIIWLKPCFRSTIVKMFQSPMLSNSSLRMGMGYLFGGVTRLKGL
jgi:hypothetical protein